MKEKKGRLREIIQTQRGLLDEEEWRQSSAKIVERYCSMDYYKRADIILAYMSIGREVDLSPLFDRCYRDGKRLAVPRVLTGAEEDAQMEFVFIEKDTVMKESSMHIREPEEGEVFLMKNYRDRRVEMIMPGLCFDLCGTRLGYGGGYYDRYLAGIGAQNIHKTALAFDFQLMNRMPCEEQDVGYDLLITDKRYYIY